MLVRYKLWPFLLLSISLQKHFFPVFISFSLVSLYLSLSLCCLSFLSQFSPLSIIRTFASTFYLETASSLEWVKKKIENIKGSPFHKWKDIRKHDYDYDDNVLSRRTSRWDILYIYSYLYQMEMGTEQWEMKGNESKTGGILQIKVDFICNTRMNIFLEWKK